MKTSFRYVAVLLTLGLAAFAGCSNDTDAKQPTPTELEHELSDLGVPAGATADQMSKPTAKCASLTQTYRYPGTAGELATHYRTVATANGWSPVGSVGDAETINGSSFLKDLNGTSLYLSVKKATETYDVVLRGVDAKDC